MLHTAEAVAHEVCGRSHSMGDGYLTWQFTVLCHPETSAAARNQALPRLADSERAEALPGWGRSDRTHNPLRSTGSR
jgi:hypothetical protein